MRVWGPQHDTWGPSPALPEGEGAERSPLLRRGVGGGPLVGKEKLLPMKYALCALCFLASLAAVCAQSSVGTGLLPPAPMRLSGKFPLMVQTSPLLAAPVGKRETAPLLCLRPAPPVAYFCRMEHQLGRRMALPIKFRLGTVDYVDRLEYPGRWGGE